MDNPLNDAIQNLTTARVEQAKLVEQETIKLAKLDQALEQLQHTVLVVDPAHMPRRQDYAGLGIVEAAKRWLTEVGKSMPTGDIARELLARGVKTKSKRYVPTVYATLAKSEDFVRDGDVWDLRKRR